MLILPIERVVGMSNENIDRQMEFITEQQAQLSVKLSLLTDKVDAMAGKVDKLAEMVDVLSRIQVRDEARLSRVEESFIVLVQLARITDERLDELEGRADKLEQRADKLSENMAMLVEAQARTSNNVADLAESQKVFIDLMERYIGKGNNGNSLQ
jgi:chromosome segregation ATPase